MPDELAKSDAASASKLVVATAGHQVTGPAAGSNFSGVDVGGGRPAGSLPERSSRLRVVGLSVALVIAACGLGVGIGYGVFDTAPAPSTPSTTAPPSNTATGRGTTATGPSGVSAIAAEVAPELVNITTTLAYETARGAGTGMVVASSGRVITNNHVIAGATAINATDLANGKTYVASVIGYDVSDDVAVLQLHGASGLPTVSYSGSATRLGDRVVAIGNAGGRGNPTAAAGVVTGLDRVITAQSELSGTTEHLSGLIETNAAIESGQSGGPLVNTNGRVVGMITAASNDFGFSRGASQGYAVPAASFRSIATDIVNGEGSATVHVGPTAFLGVRVTAGQGPGAFVVQVLSTSPAAAGGIVPGDLIVGLAGRTVLSPETLSAVLAAHGPGAQLQVQLRDQAGGQRMVTVTVISGPPA